MRLTNCTKRKLKNGIRMEHYFYLAVRVAVAGYILYKVWGLLFRDRLFGLWERIPVRAPRTKSKAKPSAPARKEAAQVVGRARGTYLVNPAPALEPIPLVPVEPEPDGDTYEGQDEDFEIGPDMDRPSDEELYGAGNEQPRVTDFSTGRTYEQLVEMLDYLTSPARNDDLINRTDMIKFTELQVGRTNAVGRLMAAGMDGNGESLPKQRSKMELASFDIGNYT